MMGPVSHLVMWTRHIQAMSNTEDVWQFPISDDPLEDLHQLSLFDSDVSKTISTEKTATENTEQF